MLHGLPPRPPRGPRRRDPCRDVRRVHIHVRHLVCIPLYDDFVANARTPGRFRLARVRAPHLLSTTMNSRAMGRASTVGV